MTPERKTENLFDEPAVRGSAGCLSVEPGDGRVRILVYPNRSLGRLGLVFAAGLCLSAVLPATLLMLLLGAWPIAPFLGLELLVIAGAFLALYRHQDDHEEIEIDADQITAVRYCGPLREVSRLPRYWARLVMEASPRRFRPARLWLRSHGQMIELGRAAGEATRMALAHTLMRDAGIERGTG